MINEKDIQFKAFCLWEEAGKPEGKSDYFWNRAKGMLEDIDLLTQSLINEINEEIDREILNELRSLSEPQYPYIANINASDGSTPSGSIYNIAKNNNYMDAGYIFCPYVPLTKSPISINQESFNPKKGPLTRYGRKLLKNSGKYKNKKIKSKPRHDTNSLADL